MALTKLQREICRLLAEHRIASGEGVFHDAVEALAATWDADRRVLLEHGFSLQVRRERPTFIETEVTRGDERTILQWVHDSAYRFFPLVEREPFGLTLHPFDLATNKVLALVGRVEVRDFVDVLESSEKIQPLGYLAWAASGKDPGFNPVSILEHAARSVRYSADEVRSLDFGGLPPDAAELGRRWRIYLEEARRVVEALPAETAGRCVLRRDGLLYREATNRLPSDLAEGGLVFHQGSIRGALPDLMANGG